MEFKDKGSKCKNGKITKIKRREKALKERRDKGRERKEGKKGKIHTRRAIQY